MELWINPACSKCRSARDALDEAGVEYTERRYLDDPPTTAELADVLARLGLEPWHIAREKETRDLGVDLPRDHAHRDQWLDVLSGHPQLIQRPIITADDGTTVVGRDEESVSRVVAAQNVSRESAEQG
ncbi:MAG: ArsC/Spx/MgsR family protein [Marmoricola sp.]